VFCRFDLFFTGCGTLRYLHSFPTRRSSDLDRLMNHQGTETISIELSAEMVHSSASASPFGSRGISASLFFARCSRQAPLSKIERSEEHTSELQSRENLVCRLLLEKKKETD